MKSFAKVFGLDLRSLAAYRIGLALFVLYDLISRSFDLTAHYTDAGVLPRAFATHYHTGSAVYDAFSPVILSLHMATGSTIGIAVIFLIHALAAVGLLLGYRTRLMTFAVWFLLSSLHTRNPLVLSVGDDVVRVLLFFSIFLPLGARYSIDAALNSRKEESAGPELFVSASTAVYYLQFISIYFFSALLKTGPEWRIDGTALYYAFNIDQFALPLAKILLGFPELLKVLTFTAWWVELAGGFVLLIPHRFGKLAGILLLGGLQFGIGMTLALGHNPWINAIALLPFLPSSIWNRRRKRKAIEVVYDGDCGFCRKMILILVEFFRPELISNPKIAVGKDLATLRRENSWIVRNERGESFFRFDAFIQFVAASPLLFWKAPILRLKPVHSVGTATYRFVAGHRGFFAKLLSPLRPRPARLQTPRWREALAVVLFAGALIYNAAWVLPIRGFSRYIEFPVLAVRLEQYWGMFAPSPNPDDGWFVMEGRLRGGTMIEAFRETREVDYEKPKSASGFYPNERWRRYMMNIGTRALSDFRAPFAGYLCRTWNKKNSGPEHLEQLSLLFMQEVTPPPGGQSKVEKLTLGKYTCAP